MSPIAASTPASSKGIKGKRVVGKPGRFDPDRPFHMSTRKGGHKTSSASAPSANGSAEDFESRRPSSDAERPVTANSNGTQASKGTYASDFSPPQPVPDVDMTEAPLDVPTVWPGDNERKSRSPTPAQQTTPSRKRKRSSPSPPPAPPSDDGHLEIGGGDDFAPPEDDYDSDTVQVIRQDDLSDREESINGEADAEEEADESPNSSRSQEAAPTYDPMAGTSVDATPIISEQPSPATSGSAEDDQQYEDTTITKPLTAALKEVEAEQVEPVHTEQAEDEPMVDTAPGIDDADEIEEQVRTDEDGRMVVRRGRFGGRRRAQHPNIDIEVAMRRQAQLKSAYRTLARAQKNVLIELATRTIDDLEANPNLHTEVAEFESIMRGLDASLAKRKATIQAQHDMKLKQLQITRDGEQNAIVDKCRQQLEDMEEAKVDLLQYEFLRIARTAQLEDVDETEDEDDFIPRPKQTAYHWKRGAGIGEEFDSRSRLAIETRRAAEDMQARYNMHEILKELPKADKPQKRDTFAVMDERPRTAASKNREGQDTLEMLVAAGEETERRANIPIIPNEQAVGLQMLANLSVRPSILGTGRQNSDSAPGPGTGRNPPPPLHLQVPRGHSPIQLQMSPRTQHAMGNRFDTNHMPPPSTPRQEASAPGGRSPSFRKHERRPSSPSRQEQRTNDLQGSASNEPVRSPAQQPRINQAEVLQQRIASRDGALQDDLFGSPARNNRPFPGFPGWRSIDAPEGPRRRAASHSDLASPFGIRPEPQPEGRRAEQSREQGRPTIREAFKDESPKFDPVHAQSLRWPDQFHSQAGAPNGRKDETSSPKSEQRSMIGTPGHQHSSSSGQDSAAGNKTSLQNSRNSNFGKFSHKTNKAERNGAPRRQKHKDRKKQHQQQEDGRSESTGTPTTAPAQYAGSPSSDMRAPSPWFSGPPPLHSPRDYHPPSHFPHHHSGSYGGPPPPHNFPPHHPPGPPMHHHSSSYDYGFHHRNSFPPAPPPWHGSGGPPPPSSLYGLSHSQQQHPPPPGVPPDQYNRPFAPPPPPPGFQGPPHTPQTPHPHSAGPGPALANNTNNGNSNHQQNNNNFRGPAIAPAGAFNPGGFRSANPPLPAFAQQQQQNGGSGSGSGAGSRRRTQSDVSFAKFLPLWKPKDGG